MNDNRQFFGELDNVTVSFLLLKIGMVYKFPYFFYFEEHFKRNFFFTFFYIVHIDQIYKLLLVFL